MHACKAHTPRLWQSTPPFHRCLYNEGLPGPSNVVPGEPGDMGIMDKEMETTMMGYIGFKV